MDLSWPLGQSVNAGVKKNSYFGTYFDLKYPSIDHIVKKLKALGTGALLYKVDISRAFRHLRIDPGDIDLLGIYHHQLFLDVLCHSDSDSDPDFFRNARMLLDT